MPVNKFSVSLEPQISARLERREGARSTVINTTLERYFWLVDMERRQLRQLLNNGEIALICDVLNGTMFADPYSVNFVSMEVQDSISMDRLDEKWQIDGPALVQKLKGLSYGTMLALVDAVQMWWHRISQGESLQPTIEHVLSSESRQ
jgi:hypothetical protein